MPRRTPIRIKVDLRDTVAGTVSVGRAFGRSFPRGTWGFTATVGLTKGTPDLTFGLVWRARLG